MTLSPETSRIARIALHWRDLGYGVVPLKDKVPDVPFKDWDIIPHHLARRRIGDIFAADLYDDVQQGGLVLDGFRGTQPLIVVDVDDLSFLSDVRSTIPHTPLESTTGREGGGRHLFFKRDPKTKTGSHTLLQLGSDLKSFHGYVVVPGSIHVSGVEYRAYVDGQPIDPLGIDLKILRSLPTLPDDSVQALLSGDKEVRLQRAARAPRREVTVGAHQYSSGDSNVVRVPSGSLSDYYACAQGERVYPPCCPPGSGARTPHGKVNFRGGNRTPLVHCFQHHHSIVEEREWVAEPMTTSQKIRAMREERAKTAASVTPSSSAAQVEAALGQIAEDHRKAPVVSSKRAVPDDDDVDETLPPSKESLVLDVYEDIRNQRVNSVVPDLSGLAEDLGIEDPNSEKAPPVYRDRDITLYTRAAVYNNLHLYDGGAPLDENGELVDVLAESVSRTLRYLAERRSGSCHGGPGRHRAENRVGGTISSTIMSCFSWGCPSCGPALRDSTRAAARILLAAHTEWLVVWISDLRGEGPKGRDERNLREWIEADPKRRSWLGVEVRPGTVERLYAWSPETAPPTGAALKALSSGLRLEDFAQTFDTLLDLVDLKAFEKSTASKSVVIRGDDTLRPALLDLRNGALGRWSRTSRKDPKAKREGVGGGSHEPGEPRVEREDGYTEIKTYAPLPTIIRAAEAIGDRVSVETVEHLHVGTEVVWKMQIDGVDLTGADALQASMGECEAEEMHRRNTTRVSKLERALTHSRERLGHSAFSFDLAPHRGSRRPKPAPRRSASDDLLDDE